MNFFSHVTILTANLSIKATIKISHNLHTPMYFFLCGLSCLETCATVVIIPRMLVDLLSDSKMISLLEYVTQMLFFLSLGTNNCFIMTSMSYDHYTAICNLLHYSMLVTRKVCFQLMMASWVFGFLVSLCIVIIIFNLSYCDSKTIQHFCDIAPVVSLACDSTSLHKVVISVLCAFVLVGSFILIMISYVFIVKMPSAKGRYKTSTFSSHLTVVSIHYGFASFVYLRPKNSDSFREDKLMAVTYTVLTPLLNPIVYSLRNKEMQLALSKVVGNANSFIHHLANKRTQECLENVQRFDK